jgi:hypothetical protein
MGQGSLQQRQATIMIDTKTIQDCGFSFLGSKNGLNAGTVGGFARHVGYYDVKKLFGPKMKHRKKGVQYE